MARTACSTASRCRRSPARRSAPAEQERDRDGEREEQRHSAEHPPEVRARRQRELEHAGDHRGQRDAAREHDPRGDVREGRADLRGLPATFTGTVRSGERGRPHATQTVDTPRAMVGALWPQ